MLCSMGSTYKPFSLSENQVDTGPSWFNLKYLPFWSRKTYVTKIQPFQVIPFRLVWLGLISWQSTQHHWNTLWLLWSNKNITTTIWTCPDPGWQNMFMKKESSWCWLVPNFKLPHFYGIQKNTTSEDVNIENWWFPSSLEALKKAHVVRNLICKTSPPKNNLDCSLQYYWYRLLNKKQLNPNKNPNFFPAEMCFPVPRGLVVVAGQ